MPLQFPSVRLPPKPKFLHGIPSNSIRIIAILITVNLLVWIVVAIVLHFHPALISPAALSYALGLRHALDADHIAAIDLMTRRLIASGQRPATLVKRLKEVLAQRRAGDGDDLDEEDAAAAQANNQLQLEGGGFMTRLLKVFLKTIDRPWKMYPLGVVFGLGFDTSSEIAVLGIASIQAVQGTSIWLILIFPILFTSGMCLVDSTDGALMMALYTSKAFSRDVVAILYYSIVLTGITVVVSAFIGIIQVLSLAQNVANPTGRFWDGVSAVGDHFDIIGSVLVYGPWRRRVERRNREVFVVGVDEDDVEAEREEALPRALGEQAPNPKTASTRVADC
ncbi:high-affinity nickel-transport protein domain-containing protein [Trichoderma breve]|uniref:Nickel/cobalt efflux system n=1 Tax=Trichoderma breve TaxID=2034170 RepID=A0A9W9BJJ3_9HYPO|nr:high-affinity nickel-transport protein domain-containing protein [Trichoderma breve]KAJ4860666.1 high-affinity nickel-transport protein domain-containing protein [Trichoderma breve]